MYKVIIILIFAILFFKILNIIIRKRKNDKFIKAGKKWENIVKELSRKK